MYFEQTHTTSPDIFRHLYLVHTPYPNPKQKTRPISHTGKKKNPPHLLNHSFDLPLLAEHHVVQVFDPLTEIHSFTLQIFGPKHTKQPLSHTHQVFTKVPRSQMHKGKGAAPLHNIITLYFWNMKSLLLASETLCWEEKHNSTQRQTLSTD